MATPTGAMMSREDKSPNSSKQPTRTSLEIWMTSEEPVITREARQAHIEELKQRNKERAEKAKKQMPR